MKNSNITIVLSEEARFELEKQAAIFGGNKSAYITHLILMCKAQLGPVSGSAITHSPNAHAQTISNSKVKTKIKK